MHHCIKNCVGCDRQLRRGRIVQPVGPLTPYPRFIEYDVCQKERSAILRDGTMVKLTKEVKIQ